MLERQEKPIRKLSLGFIELIEFVGLTQETRQTQGTE